MSACVPERVSVALLFAPAVIVAAPASVTIATPLVTVTRTVERLPSTSLTLSTLPFVLLNSSEVLIGVPWIPGTVFTGASAAGVTVTSITSEAVEKANEPPPAPGSTLVPALPLVVSHARRVNAAGALPL